jgi:hypothetical protein
MTPGAVLRRRGDPGGAGSGLRLGMASFCQQEASCGGSGGSAGPGQSGGSGGPVAESRDIGSAGGQNAQSGNRGRRLCPAGGDRGKPSNKDVAPGQEVLGSQPVKRRNLNRKVAPALEKPPELAEAPCDRCRPKTPRRVTAGAGAGAARNAVLQGQGAAHTGSGQGKMAGNPGTGGGKVPGVLPPAGRGGSPGAGQGKVAGSSGAGL